MIKTAISKRNSFDDFNLVIKPFNSPVQKQIADSRIAATTHKISVGAKNQHLRRLHQATSWRVTFLKNNDIPFLIEPSRALFFVFSSQMLLRASFFPR
jgi:hypothetical protein